MKGIWDGVVGIGNIGMDVDVHDRVDRESMERGELIEMGQKHRQNELLNWEHLLRHAAVSH